MTQEAKTLLLGFTAAIIVGMGAWSYGQYQATLKGDPYSELVRPVAKRLVLVELFQAQGCSSCPPANANLNLIADRPDVVALSFAVTYWDRLGWKDSFASEQFTDRQSEYARANARTSVGTPQVWIDGHRTIVGHDPAQLSSEIARANGVGPPLAISQNVISVGKGNSPHGGADVWLAHYDPAVRQVAVRAGENRGRTLPHPNIVRSLNRIGHWSGKATKLVLPSTPTGLRSAVFLQAGAGGRVLAEVRGQ